MPSLQCIVIAIWANFVRSVDGVEISQQILKPSRRSLMGLAVPLSIAAAVGLISIVVGLTLFWYFSSPRTKRWCEETGNSECFCRNTEEAEGGSYCGGNYLCKFGDALSWPHDGGICVEDCRNSLGPEVRGCACENDIRCIEKEDCKAARDGKCKPIEEGSCDGGFIYLNQAHCEDYGKCEINMRGNLRMFPNWDDDCKRHGRWVQYKWTQKARTEATVPGDIPWFKMVKGGQSEDGEGLRGAPVCVKNDDVTMGGRVQCCKQNGGLPSYLTKNHRPGCNKDKTQKEASDICEETIDDNERMRQCTAEEILGYKGAGTGCEFDNYFVWSSTPCKPSAEDMRSTDNSP